MFPVSILTFSIKGTICDRCFLCPSLYLNYWHNVIDGTHPMSILTSESLARRGRCILCPSLLLNHWQNVLDLHYILISESLARRGRCILCPSLFLNHWHNVICVGIGVPYCFMQCSSRTLVP